MQGSALVGSGARITDTPTHWQVEYANKAVDNAGTVIGLRCKDGVVLAVEKLVQSKLLVPGANRRIATVDLHAGVVSLDLDRASLDPSSAPG